MEQKEFELLEKYALYLNMKTKELGIDRIDYVADKYNYQNLNKIQMKTALKAGFKLAHIDEQEDYHGSHSNEYGCLPIDSLEKAELFLRNRFCRIALDPSYSRIETPLMTKTKNVYSETIQLIDMLNNDDNNFIKTLINSEAAISHGCDVAYVQEQINDIILNKDVHLTFYSSQDYNFFDFYSGNILSISEASDQIKLNFDNKDIDITDSEKDNLLTKLKELEQYKECDFEKDAKDYYKDLSKKDMSIAKLKKDAQNKIKEMKSKQNTDKIKEKHVELQK